VLLIEPKDHWRPLVVTVTELASLTVDEAKRRPDKVRAAIQRTLDKPRRVFVDERSIPSDFSLGILSKPIGEAPLERLAVTETIESPSL